MAIAGRPLCDALERHGVSVDWTRTLGRGHGDTSVHPGWLAGGRPVAVKLTPLKGQLRKEAHVYRQLPHDERLLRSHLHVEGPKHACLVVDLAGDRFDASLKAQCRARPSVAIGVATEMARAARSLHLAG